MLHDKVIVRSSAAKLPKTFYVKATGRTEHTHTYTCYLDVLSSMYCLVPCEIKTLQTLEQAKETWSKKIHFDKNSILTVNYLTSTLPYPKQVCSS